jgi:hypothetical protein
MPVIHWDPFRAIRHRDDFFDESLHGFELPSGRSEPKMLENGILTITIPERAQAEACRVGVRIG